MRSYLVRRAARIVPAYYVAILGTLALLSLSGRRARPPARRRGEAAAVLRVRAELLPRHAPEAERGDVDARGRGRVLPDAAGGRLARAARVPRTAPAGRRCCSRVSPAAGLRGTPSTTPRAGDRSPRTRRRRSCRTSPAGCWWPCWSRRAVAAAAPPLGRGASAALVAGAAAVLFLNGWWHATGAHDSVAMEVLADCGAAVAFAAVIASLVLGTGSGARWMGVRPLAWMGEITYGFYLWHIPLIVCARGLGVLPGGILSGVDAAARRDRVRRRELVPRRAADHAPRRAAAAGRAGRVAADARPATAARSARSRSRTPAHSGSLPASSSGRAAAARR